MLKRSLPVLGILILSGAPLPAVAQVAAGGTTSPQISPLRLEFTRPGGTPGSARYIAASSQQGFMLAPAQPTETTTPKKKVRR
jgi:hypothetical protein